MTLHADARRALGGWAPPSVGQRTLRDDYLAHLAGHPDAMWRSCHPDHLTASAILISDDLNRVALTLHRKLGRWLQFGGHCEDGDRSLAAAAARETREESGLDDIQLDPVPVLLSRHAVPCGPIRPAHHLDVQFVATAQVDAVLSVSDESADVRWFEVDELPADSDDSVRELTAAAIRRLRGIPQPDPSPRNR